MELRAAVPADVPGMVDVGALMHCESPRFRRLQFDRQKVEQTLSSLVAGEHGFVFVAVMDGEIVGGLAAFVAPHWFSNDLAATDLALFVRPSSRGAVAVPKLISEYVAWAKQRGAVLIQMGISTGVHVEATERLYTRTGLVKFGSLFEVA